MAQIYKATSNFSPSLKIGQGGFGTVYKATLEDGTLVAVKRAKRVCQKMIAKRGTLADLMCENWGNLCCNQGSFFPFSSYFCFRLTMVNI